MTNLVATTPITTKAMKSLYTKLNRQKDLKQIHRKKYKDLQAVMTTTTEPHTTLQQPVVVTSSKVNVSPQVLKVTPGGQGKKSVGEKERVISNLIKERKNAVKSVKSSALGVVTSAGPSSNLRNKIRDKAKVTVALIQELTEELQAIEQEYPNDDHDSKATQESDQSKKTVTIV